MDNEKLALLIEEFFKNNTPNIYVDKTQTNDRKIRIKDIKSDVYININWNEVVCELFYGKEENFIEYISDSLNVADFLLDIADYRIYTSSNKNLKQWLFYQEPENRVISGIYETKQNYAEIEIEENCDFINSYYDSIGFKDLMTHFYMGNIEVKISSPSDFYRLVFFHHISEKIIRLRPNYISWNENLWKNRLTISMKNIKGINKESSINNILQEALFLLRLFNKEIFRLGITTYFNENSINDLEQDEIKRFPKSNFTDSFCFYNEAYRYTSEMKFLNFYKVLEYFYDINKKELAMVAVNKYSNSLEKLEERNEKLHTELKNIYTNNELMQLKNLLKNECILDYAYDLVENNFDEQISIERFGELLYKVRNAIVHSKETSRRVPKILVDEDTLRKNKLELKLSEWINIVEELSLICIQHFCYNNQFDIIEKFSKTTYK